MFKKQIENLDTKLRVDEHNTQGLMSMDSIRKLRSEQICEKQLSKDDIEDLKCYKKSLSDDQYVQEIIDPFAVYMYSQTQFDVLKNELKNRTDDNEVVAHIDATGAIFRLPTENCPMSYYYAVIITFKTASHNDTVQLFPVFEMLSSQHGIPAIGNWLRMTKEKFCSQLWFSR